MKTALQTFIEELSCTNPPVEYAIIKKLAQSFLPLEEEQIKDAWSAGHRVVTRNPTHDVTPDEYYDDQFD